MEDEIIGLKLLLADKEYIALRARYDVGQLSFYGQIREIEKRITGAKITGVEGSLSDGNIPYVDARG